MDQVRFKRVSRIVDDAPAIDIHSHLGTGGVWQARDLADIMFYHWLGTEFRNAGCPEEMCTNKHNQEKASDVQKKVKAAIPYCASIRNTSNFWAYSGIMRDLYGLKKPLDGSNWEKALGMVAEHASDASWEQEVLKRAKIEKVAVDVNFTPRDARSYFPYYCAEPLYGVGLGKPDYVEGVFEEKNLTAAKLSAGLSGVVERLTKEKGIRAFHVWLPATWRYTNVDEHEIDQLLQYWLGGAILSAYEQNCLASFSADVMAKEAGKHGLVVQLFHGSTAYGKGYQVGTWHPDYLRTLIYHMENNPETMYDLFLATRNASHEATSMARMHTNLMVSGAWWHGFTPSTLTEFFRDRLEMLPVTRWNAFYSDAYCVEWCYGKLLLTKNRLSVALTRLIDEGLIGEEDVAYIARAVLYENPKREYLSGIGR